MLDENGALVFDCSHLRRRRLRLSQVTFAEFLHGADDHQWREGDRRLHRILTQQAEAVGGCGLRRTHAHIEH